MPKNYRKLKAIIVFGVLLIMIFAAGLFFLANSSYDGSGKVMVVTEKTTYTPQDDLKVKVENNMNSNICFSSCYPYFIQDDSGGWTNNQYASCGAQDIATDCINPKGIKAFAISLGNMFLSNLPHRIAVPACVGCILGEKFSADKIFYSNQFQINK